ncbi:MAG: hypothetical protein WCS97_02895 [Candidatus Paceibacterota bacterium]
MIKVEALADVHTHLREKEIAEFLVIEAVSGGADVLGVMPNTKKGLTTAKQVDGYIDRFKSRKYSWMNVSFIPFVMITESTTKWDIDECVKHGIFDGKVYPFMRTTKSENGVRRYGKILPTIRHCGEVGMKVHFHPEHPSMIFGNRDAEFAFLPIVRMYLEETSAVIVWEHGTDARCIPHWEEMAVIGRFYVTLTAHHLATNEDLTFGDVRSVCKPPIKTENDRQSLVGLVVKDYDWVIAGGDSAFHPKSAKQVEKGCCACGAFTAPFLLPLYANALDGLLATEKGVKTFVNFTSRNARRLHCLPKSSRTLKLVRGEQQQIPLSYPIGTQTAMPFGAGQYINWKLV